jgi:Fur family peroxide stress response transcriptional regulator
MKSTQTIRQTKYCTDIETLLRKLGHASNATLLDKLRNTYPDLSPTTVHRATTRLAERGQIALAPISASGVMMYDTNTSPHDHFVCQLCHRVRDINVAKTVIPEINKALGECRVTGRLVVYGSCNICLKRK